MNANRILRVSTDSPMKGHQTPMGATFQSPARSRPDTLLSIQKSAIAEGMWSPCSNCSSDENNSPTALNSFNWDKPALEDKSVDFSWTSPSHGSGPLSTSSVPQEASHENSIRGSKRPLSSGYANVRSDSEDKDAVEEESHIRVVATTTRNSPDRVREEKQKAGDTKPEIHPAPSFTDSACSPCHDLLGPLEDAFNTSDTRSPKSASLDQDHSFSFSTPAPCQRNEPSQLQKEQEELRGAAWFQAGIPREIALEVLSGQPVGSFIVRESTTKPGCYALSLRIPPGHNHSGIAHYLILHTSKGYKIKGFTKEFNSLGALITHHSVMPELLPCPLSLPRYNNDRARSGREAEMEYVQTDQRCQLFSDIHWLMNDLEL